VRAWALLDANGVARVALYSRDVSASAAAANVSLRLGGAGSNAAIAGGAAARVSTLALSGSNAFTAANATTGMRWNGATWDGSLDGSLQGAEAEQSLTPVEAGVYQVLLEPLTILVVTLPGVMGPAPPPPLSPPPSPPSPLTPPLPPTPGGQEPPAAAGPPPLVSTAPPPPAASKDAAASPSLVPIVGGVVGGVGGAAALALAGWALHRRLRRRAGGETATTAEAPAAAAAAPWGGGAVDTRAHALEMYAQRPR